jgi:hypothetical protein
MDDRFERSPRLGVAEDDASERGTIEGPVGGEHAAAERRRDGREPGRPHGDHFARQRVGVDRRGAERGKALEAVRLPRRDSAG